MTRDEFPTHTKRALALRAGYVCSNCGKPTVGPSEEAPDAITMIGVAAHISAAAPGPGARRYNPALTPNERASFENGIWLCQSCSVIIDRDEVTYSIPALQEMKRNHEASRKLTSKPEKTDVLDDIIAIGPNIISVGEFTGVDSTGWKARIKHFIIGDALDLINFSSDFTNVPVDERYVLMNALGNGRLLSGAPSISRSENEYVVVFPILASAPRISAHNIGTSMAISRETGDIFTIDGKIAQVSGLNSLRQNIEGCLGLAYGDNVFHPKAGTRISQFYRDFSASTWLCRLIKIEIIRLAAIPRKDKLSKTNNPPLLCVDRVREVEISEKQLTNQRLPVRISCDVHGVGYWEHEIGIFIYTDEQLQNVANRKIPTGLAHLYADD